MTFCSPLFCQQAVGQGAILQAVGQGAVLQAVGQGAVLQAVGQGAVLQAVGQGAVLQAVGQGAVLQAVGHGAVLQAVGHGAILQAVGHGAVGQGAVLQDDNARPHGIHAVSDFLRQRQLTRTAWPARSPDLSPIEHVWGVLEWRMRANHPPPYDLNHMFQILQHEWKAIHQETLKGWFCP